MFWKRFLALAAFVLPSLASEIHWTASGPGLYDDPANWTRAGGAHVVPGINDTVFFVAGQSPSPTGVFVKDTVNFSMQQLTVQGLNTLFLLNGTFTNNISTTLSLSGVPGGDNPVTLGITGTGTINVGQQVSIGTEGGVDSVLGVSNSANLNTSGLRAGGVNTQGIVGVNGGSITTTSISLGLQSPLGALSIQNGSVFMNGVGSSGVVNVGGVGGTGVISVQADGLLRITNGQLKVGDTGSGGLNIAGATSSSFGFHTLHPATVDATTNDVLVGADTGGTGSVTIDPGGTLNTSGSVSIGSFGGSGNISVSGALDLFLTSNNHIIPGTLNAGSLSLGVINGNGNLVVGDFANVTASQLTVGASGGTGILRINGVIGGNMVISGDAHIGIDGGTGNFVIEQPLSGITVNGVLSVGTGNGGAAGGVSSAGIINAGGLQVGVATGNTGVMQLSGQSVTTVSGPSTFGVAGGQGTLLIQDTAQFKSTDATAASVGFGLGGTGALSITGQGSLVSPGTVTLGTGGAAGSGQVAGAGLLSAGALVLGNQGTGTLILDGTGGTGSGQLAVSGTVTLGANGGSGSLRAINGASASVTDVSLGESQGSTGVISVESGSSFQATGALSAGSTTSGGGTGSSVMVVNQATAGFGSATIGHGGDLALLQVNNGGVFITAASLTVGSNGLMVVTDAGSKVSVGGGFSVSGPVAAAPVPNSNLALVQNGGELDAAQVSVGVGGTGTLVANGADSRVNSLGTTTIAGGGGTGTVVLQNGATLQSTGDVTVNTGGTLIGSGHVVGTVVNNGGTVVPGGSPGVLEITGDYTQTAGSFLSFELFGPTPDLYDRLIVDGNLDLAGTLRLMFGFQPTGGTVFDLITVGGTAIFSDLHIDMVGLNAALIGDFSNGKLTVEAVPEPGPATLVLAGALALLLRSRRSRGAGR